ncbi:MAG: hypothetical protein MK082_05355 [Phycisphaerales bacterium]|nr:hypothetical protein [Phycisphaerales bacterium]
MKKLPLILLGTAMFALLAGTQDTKKRVGDPYPLTICPVSQRALGANPVTVILEDMPDEDMNGRELKFCCGGCQSRFLADADANMAKLDEKIVKDQLKFYPDANCIVMPDDELSDPRGPEAMEDKNVVYGNRLYRFCCKACIRRFKKDPKPYRDALDKLVIEQQKASYPMEVCVITGRPLGDNPQEFVVANRLVKTCCGGCASRVKNDPTASIAKLDDARKAKSTKTSN